MDNVLEFDQSTRWIEEKIQILSHTLATFINSCGTDGAFNFFASTALRVANFMNHGTKSVSRGIAFAGLCKDFETKHSFTARYKFARARLGGENSTHIMFYIST